jgi:hypothetical protein
MPKINKIFALLTCTYFLNVTYYIHVLIFRWHSKKCWQSQMAFTALTWYGIAVTNVLNAVKIAVTS